MNNMNLQSPQMPATTFGNSIPRQNEQINKEVIFKINEVNANPTANNIISQVDNKTAEFNVYSNKAEKSPEENNNITISTVIKIFEFIFYLIGSSKRFEAFSNGKNS